MSAKVIAAKARNSKAIGFFDNRATSPKISVSFSKSDFEALAEYADFRGISMASTVRLFVERGRIAATRPNADGLVEALIVDIEKLTSTDVCVTWCEGCSAPLLTCDDYVTGEDCSGCWHTMAEGEWPDKPCYAYRVGKESAALSAFQQETDRG